MPDYSDSILKDIGRSYVISSLLPASIFMVLAVLIFKGLVPSSIKTSLVSSIVPFGGLIASAILVTTWLGFVLYSSQSFTIPFFEGYYFSDRFADYLRKKQIKQHESALKDYSEYSKIYFDLLEKKPKKNKKKAEWNAQLKSSYEVAYNALRDLHLYIPLKESAVMPTRLGNVLRASEFYPNQRYGFDGVTIWPRLSRVLPEKFISDLEELNNRFIFLLNSALVLFILSAACLLVSLFFLGKLLLSLLIPFLTLQFSLLNALYQTWILSRPAQTSVQIPAVTPGLFGPLLQTGFFLVCALVLLGSGYLLYRFSVVAAVDFSVFLRTGYDLYRFDLLKQLNIKLPERLSEEQPLWEEISDFYVAAELKKPDLSYYFEKPEKDSGKSGD